MPYTYPIEIKHIFISPAHNYFGRSKDGPGTAPTHDVDSVEARAGLGLVGDRYYGVPAHFEAQVTLIAWEVLQEMGKELGLRDVFAVLARRNIVTQGANLNQLLGQEFVLASGEDRVRLQGTKPCSPCAWMNAAYVAGAHQFLRGRGGLRARIVNSGHIHKGPATLQSQIDLDLATVTQSLSRPRLP